MTARVDAPPASPPGPPGPAGGARWRAYAGAVGLCAAAAALAWPLARALDAASLVLIFLLAVVLAAARFGRGPALLAAGLSVLLFNLLFVAPRFSLAVADERFVFTFGVMLVVGLLVGQLTAGLRAQARAAAEREQRVRSLYEISRELGGAIAPEQVAEAVRRFAAAQHLGTAWLWTLDRSDRLAAIGDVPDEGLTATARRMVDTGRSAGGDGDDDGDGDGDGDGNGDVNGTCGDRGAPAAMPVLVLPLRATMAVRGALALRRAPGRPWSEDERRLLDTCATLLAGTLERLHYIEVARASAVYALLCPDVGEGAHVGADGAHGRTTLA